MPPKTQPTMTATDFANKVRAKYPSGIASDGRAYKDIPDEELAGKIVAKYPAYKTQVDIPIQTSFKAKIGGASTIPGNVARTFGNIPSDVGQIAETTIANPAKNIAKSIEQTKNIYKEQGAKEGTKNIVKGFGETAKSIFKAPGEILVNAGDKQDTQKQLTPIQEQTLKQRDEIMQKLQDAHKTGKDTSHLVLALKYNQDTLDSLNSQIGTKEQNAQKGVDTLTKIAKYPIEHPVQTAIAVQQGGQSAGIEDPIHSIAKPIIQPVKNFVNSEIKAITPNIQNYYKKQELEIFNKPTEVSKPAYNKATQVAKNGRGNPAETLVNNGVKTSDIIDGKNYNTSDTVDQLRQDAIKMSNEGLRPAIEQASYSTPKVSVDNVITQATKNLQNSSSATLSSKEAQIANLQKEGTLLKQKYPDGMSLLDMHDNRITYSMNGGFSPVGDPSVNNIATVNRAFSKTLDNLVAQNVPEDLPYKAFQKELSKQFQAADYLQALHGKAVPRSILQDVAKTTAKVAGAAVGNAVGGGVLGTVGGYHLGGTLESAFENMSNPAKSYFLRNLQQSNPEAFTALKDYIGRTESEKLLQLALPAPSELGTSKNPIITPSPTTYEKATPRTNYENTSPSLAEAVKKYDKTLREISPDQPESWYKYQLENQPFMKNPEKFGYSSNSLDQSGSVKNPITKPNISTNIPKDISQTIKDVKKLPTSTINKTIENHLTSAETLVDELSKAEFKKLGGLDKLLERTVTNISDQLKSQGFAKIATQIKKIDLDKVKSLDDLDTAILNITKGK